MTLHHSRAKSTGLLLGSLLLGLVILTNCSPRREVTRGVQLFPNTTVIEPTATFELRFEADMVAPDQLGRAATASPLVFTPPLPGEFVWLSRRSGVYTPTNAPTLGTLYRLRLAPGLREADGQPSQAAFERWLRTPGLEVMSHAPQTVSSTNASAVPRLCLDFNAAVRPVDAAAHAFFVNANGSRVPARVEAATLTVRSEVAWQSYFYSPTPPPTWVDRFESARVEPALPGLALPLAAPVPEATAEPPQETPLPNVLLVTPEQPLPVGSGWALVVKRGLPAVEGRARLEADYRIELGDVHPLALLSAEPRNQLNAGRWARFTFSKPLAGTLNPTNVLEWFTITPRPAHLTGAVDGAVIDLHGGFELGTNYHVLVRAGIPAAEPFTLGAPRAEAMVFDPLPPRLYFPGFAIGQWADGRREFPLLCVNTPEVGIRSKVLDAQTLVHALRGYQSYFRPYRPGAVEDPDEVFVRIDPNLVPGRTVYETNLAVPHGVDEAARLTLRAGDLLGGRRFGAVFVSAESFHARGSWAGVGTEALLQVTDLGLAWKRAPGMADVRVFSLTTGRPLTDTTVRWVTDENQVLAEARTDGRGLAHFKGVDQDGWWMAEAGEDLRAVKPWSHHLPLYQFNVPIEWDARTNDIRVFLFTDRPVYRPGETVRLKAIAREWRDGRPAFPAGQSAAVRWTNSRDQLVAETNLVFGQRGSWATELVLPPAPLGEYGVEVQVGERSHYHAFRVDDYRPNTFEVVVQTRDTWQLGEALEARVTARYLLGQPLTRGEVRWSLEASDEGFKPEGFGPFDFCSQIAQEELDRRPGSAYLQGAGPYSNRTNFVIAPELEVNPRAPQPRSGRFLVELTDLNQQTLSGSAAFTLHSSEFYLGLKRSEGVLRAGQGWPLELIAVRHDGSPWTNPVPAQVKLSRVEWRTVSVQGAGGRPTYMSEAEVEELETVACTTRPVRRVDAEWQVAPGGPAAPVLSLEAAGQYLVEVEAQDPAGRAVVTAVLVHVAGEEQLAWDYRNDVRVELVPDKPVYRVGETARLLVKTPIAGEAWVTLERERVLRSYSTRLEGNAPMVEFPIEATDLPNVFASVLVVRGAAQSAHTNRVPEFRLGYCELRVERPDDRLEVRVEPSAASYRPRDRVRVVTTVRDADGRAVPAAEVTLFAVDEGVLRLMGYQAPDPAAFFFEPRRLAVTTGITLPDLLPEDPAELAFQNKGYLIGGGGSLPVRRHFVACAFWQADLETSADGTVAVEFAAPDNLTEYRLVAVVHASASQFGHGEAAFAVNKPLMIEPATPRFARRGDRIEARSVVLNRTDRAGEVEVVLELDDKAHVALGGQATNRLSRRLTVPAQSATNVDVPIVFTDLGESRWRWTARFAAPAGGPGPAADAEPAGGGFTDAVELGLEVKPPVPALRASHRLRLNAGETNLVADADPQLLEGRGTVSVRVANTRLAALGRAVPELLHYPYGCVEQTASALIPWLVLRDIPGLLEAGAKTNPPAHVIRAGVQRLLSMQSWEGGLSYWPGDRQAFLFGSAYGGLALALARRQDAPVPHQSFSNLVGYLSRQVRRGADGGTPWGLGDRCLGCYTLAVAGQPEAPTHEVLFGQRDRLSPSARAWLALAILESHGPAQLVEQLLGTPTPTAGATEPDLFGNAASATAARLLAWVRFRPTAGEVDALVGELIEGAQEGHWQSTQGNAWAVLALAAYATEVEARRGPARGFLDWGQVEPEFELKSAVDLVTRSLPYYGHLPLLRLTHRGGGPLFVQTDLEAYPPALALPRQDHGFALDRVYEKLNDDNQPAEARDLRVGDRVLVTLTVEVREAASFVVIDDALPCLLEAINPAFASQQTRGGEPVAQRWISSHRELRADRAVFFCDRLEPGRYALRYLTRVRAAGDAAAPPAKVEAMYRPDRYGLTASGRLVAGPAE